MSAKMAYSDYWIPAAAEHLRECIPLPSLDVGYLTASGILVKLVASAMAKAFEHVEEQLENERIEVSGGHRNQAGGWCSPEHGNTCGMHPEFDGAIPLSQNDNIHTMLAPIHNVSSNGQPLRIIIEHVKTGDGTILVDITAEHGPNYIFSDCNFDNMPDALMALVNRLQGD